MADDWNARAASYLVRSDICPRCGEPVIGTSCARCRADFASPEAQALRALSERIAGELHERSARIFALPSARTEARAPAPLPVPETIVHDVPAARPSVPVPQVAPRSSVTLQSVMAVAGAGLLAVAAIVFSYVNPDFTDVGARSVVLLAVTALMVGGAALLIRFGLRFSAEAIGALGGVFVALDIQSVAEFIGTDVSPWILGAVGCVIGAVLLGGLGVLVRLRAWIWYAAAGITLAPALFGYAFPEPAPTFGHLVAIAVSLLAQPAIALLSGRMGARLTAARVTSTVFRLLATLVVLAELATAYYPFHGTSRALFSAAVLVALALFSALGALAQLPRLGAAVAGILGVTAVTVGSLALVPSDRGEWAIAILPVGAGIAAVLLAVLPLPRIRRAWLTGGAIAAVLAVGLEPAGALARTGIGLAQTPDYFIESLVFPWGTAILLGLAAVAAACAILWRITRRSPETRRLARVPLGVGLWTAPLIGLALLAAPEYPIDLAVPLGLIPAAGAALALLLWPRVGASPIAFRVPLVLTMHLLPVVVAPVVLTRHALLVPLGAAVLVVWLLAAAASPRAVRPVHVVFGEVYALVLLGVGLHDAGLATESILPAVAIVACAAAVVVTRIRRTDADYWLGAVVVAAVPLAIAVLEVVQVRTGWTAGSAAAGAALAAVLLVSIRRGLGVVVRTVAAALLLPAIAVTVICLGAQLLAISASPVVLPVIAGLVAVALPTTGVVAALLRSRGVTAEEARSARLAIEVSALLTGAVAVLLALTRVAAGPDTAFAVLVIVGIGSVATGLFAHRRYGWVAAFASFTGALWTFLGTAGVGTPEAYALPPALAAAVIAALLLLRDRATAPARTLFAIGLVIAPLPSLGALALAGDGSDGPVPWRVVGLLGGSAVLVIAAALLPRASGVLVRLAPVRPALLGVAILAAAAGPVQGVRFGRWVDPTLFGFSSLVVWAALGVGVLGAAAAAIAGALLARDRPPAIGSGLGRRWVLIPALAYLIAGPISATHRGWAPIWILWTLAVLLLALMVAVASVSARSATALPPVWTLFVLAWITAVAGWSMRDLRVEVFSLPLGAGLLLVGMLGMRAALSGIPDRRGSLDSWPHGFRGSWRLLTPGIVVTLLPSMLATGTDPQTLRAITVLALALGAILIGSLRRLAAPFVLGIAVLPVENLIVFGAQLGRAISATSWWISLATAGAVLLVIAVTAERRSGSGRGIAARMRDLA